MEYQPSAAVPGAVPRAPWPPRPRRIARAVGAVTETVLPPRGPAPGAGLAGPRRHPRRRADAPLGPVRARPRPAALRRLHRPRPRHRRQRAALAGRPPRPAPTSSSSTAGPARAPSPANSPRRRGVRRGRGSGFDPEIAVLADPGCCVRTYGTREDFLIPSACLNSTVSGPDLAHRAARRPGRARRLPRREVLPRARRRRRLRRLPRRRRRPLRRGRRRRRRRGEGARWPPTAPRPGRAGRRSSGSARSTASTT